MANEREEARSASMRELEDLSEDINASSWYPDVNFHAWSIVDRSAEAISRHVPHPWQPEEFARLRDAIGAWPILTEGSSPEEDGSNVRWIPLEEFAVVHAPWREYEDARLAAIGADRETRVSA